MGDDARVPDQAVLRCLVGLDRGAVPLSDEDPPLQDPFYVHILAPGASGKQLPVTAEQLVAALEAKGSGFSKNGVTTFMVGDGMHIPYTDATAHLERDLRYVGVCKSDAARDNDPPDAFLVFGTDLTLEAPAQGGGGFLQCMGWDGKAGVFNWYKRVNLAGKQRWVWAGNSWHSMSPPTRGKGPFDGHVNGAVIMKELRLPWLHWNSSQFTVDAALAPDSPIRQQALFKRLQKADDLERLSIMPGVDEWNRARVAKVLRDAKAAGKLANVDHLLRQILTTTTINIESSGSQSLSRFNPSPDPVSLPQAFLFAADSLGETGVEITGALNQVSLPYKLYRSGVDSTGLYLSGNGDFKQAGDSFFAVPVPVPSFEDGILIGELVRGGALSPAFVASLLMVDFASPVYSARRAALMRYVPAEVGQVADIEAAFVAKVREAAAADAGGADDYAAEARHDFLELYGVTQQDPKGWKATFGGRLRTFVRAVQARIDNQAGAEAYSAQLQVLADSKRRHFRETPLDEFSLTFPVLPLEKRRHVRMLPDGSIVDDPVALMAHPGAY